MSVDGVIKERDFYRSKLSEIELLCLQANHKILECYKTLIDKIQLVLHQSKVALDPETHEQSLSSSDLVHEQVAMSVNLPSNPANILHEAGSSLEALMSTLLVPVRRKQKLHPNEQAVSATSSSLTPPKFQNMLDVDGSSKFGDQSQNVPSDDKTDWKDASSSYSNSNELVVKIKEESQTPPREKSAESTCSFEQSRESKVVKVQNFRRNRRRDARRRSKGMQLRNKHTRNGVKKRRPNSAGVVTGDSHVNAPKSALLELPHLKKLKENSSDGQSMQRNPLLQDYSVGAVTDDSRLNARKSALLELPFLKKLGTNDSNRQLAQRSPLLQDNLVSAVANDSHVNAPKSSLLELPFLTKLKENGCNGQSTQRSPLLQVPFSPTISKKPLLNFYPVNQQGVSVAAPAQYNLGPCLKYKTLCMHFAAGSCHQGSKCGFLHPGINGPPL